MGSCVSIHRDSESSAMKLKLSFGSKADKLVVIPPSPVKGDKLDANGDGPINNLPPKSQWTPSPSTTATTFRDYGSREESFFDSRPWLDSDCEDDFHSVNGDFTPSRGNTPVHQNLSIGSSRIKKTPFENRIPSSIPIPSPTEKKKKLLELFQESFKDDEEADNESSSGNQTMANGKMEVTGTTPSLLPKSVHGNNSVWSSERTANGDALTEKEMLSPIRSAQCCLPSLVSCRSSSQRRKMSPTIAVVDKA